MSGEKASQVVGEIMAGRTALEDAPKWAQSWAGFLIYQRAAKVLCEINKERRRNELNKLPERLRPHVEKECKRIWRIRKRA